MFCKKCGANIPDNSRFCTKCGAIIKKQSDEIHENNFEEKDVYIPQENTDYNNGRQNYEADASSSYKEERDSVNVSSGRSNTKIYIICVCIALVIALIAGTIVYRITNKNSSKTALSQQNTSSSDKTQDSESSKYTSDASTTNKSEAITTDKDKSISNQSSDADVTQYVEHKHTYKVIKQNFTWDEAKEYCEQQGGHLATITDAEEAKKVNDLINETDAKVIWLGANNLNYNGEFKWVTGEDFTYSYWADGEPNNYGGIEHYLVLYKVNGEWVWNDGPFNTNTFYDPSYIGFVCEWDD